MAIWNNLLLWLVKRKMSQLSNDQMAALARAAGPLPQGPPPPALHPDYLPPLLRCIHTDARGSMYQIMLPTNQEVMLLFSKKGARRGGHSHTVPEWVCILSGKIRYHKLIGGREVEMEREGGDNICNLPDEPHYGEFLEDTWLLEFKYGPGSADGEWESIEYEPFRKLVREGLRDGE